jgi:Domain of unknown function (DUF4249)
MKKLYILIVLFLILFSCGEGIVEVQNVSYEPRIVVEGLLIPGKKVEGIRVSKNFQINQDVNIFNALLDPQKTTVSITDEQNGSVYNLDLHIPDSLQDINGYWFGYKGNDLHIGYGNTYSINVESEYAGKQLWTSSSTTVPDKGFAINSLNYNALKFAQKKDNGDLEVFEVYIERSPGITYYLATIRPLDNSYEKLIKEHLVGELDSTFYENEKIDLSYDTSWIQNTPEYAGESILRLFWFDFYFYSEYEIIVYAADENYREFLQTYNRVQEFDGNFHEAKFNFEGDGIGYFGSAIADTTYLTVLP